MREVGVKQADVARQLNLPSQSAVSNLFSGKRKLLASEKIELERYLQIEGESNVQMVPIIGFTQAGQWREAISMPLGHMPLLSGIAGRKAFAVEVKGDSMNLLVREGGYAVVDPDERHLYNGSVYLLENSDYETTMKEYRTNPARFCPMSSNPEHQEFPVGDLHFKVIGKIVWTGSKAPNSK